MKLALLQPFCEQITKNNQLEFTVHQELKHMMYTTLRGIGVLLVQCSLRSTETIMANDGLLVETESYDQLVRNLFRIECTCCPQHSLLLSPKQSLNEPCTPSWRKWLLRKVGGDSQMDILNVCINLHTAVEALSDTRESSRSGLQASWTWKKNPRTKHQMKRIKLLLPGPALSFGLDTC